MHRGPARIARRLCAPLLAAAALAAGLSSTTPARADRAVITAVPEAGGLRVIVHGVTEYCQTNARIDVLRQGETIRLVRDRPTRVSRCIGTREMSFLVPDVAPGTYTVSYEQIPLVAPARALRLASTTTVVHAPAHE